MKKQMEQILPVILAGLLIPCLFSCFLHLEVLENKKGEESIWIQGSRGYRVGGEWYLTGLLASQMDASAPLEALKAQAILLRTLLHYRLQEQKETQQSAVLSAADIGVPRKNLSQMKKQWGKKFSAYYRKLRRAVEETEGVCIRNGGHYPFPCYHKLSAGRTRAGTEEESSWLKSAVCLYDMESEDYFQVQLNSPKKLAERVKMILPAAASLGDALRAESFRLERDSAGYVTTVCIGETACSAEAFAAQCGLQSLWFSMEDDGGMIRLLARGIGSGYGMSQTDAIRLAEEGKSCGEILQNYFCGITIGTE